MKFYYGFTIDFDKISNENVMEFISKVYDIDYTKDQDFIWWNILGNYIFWWDGEANVFYICRDYVNIKGWQRYKNDDVKKAIAYLIEFI